jgi:hypothetical protein
MKCAIALDINEGKYPATVEQFGAKTIKFNCQYILEICLKKRFTDGK